MALFFSATLALSILGLASLLGLKRYELVTGHVFLEGVRPRVGEFFHIGLSWLEHVLPALVLEWARRSALYLRTAARHAIAQTILALERMLERALKATRDLSAPRHGAGEVSKFLQEVAEHKKTLTAKKYTRVKKEIDIVE